ncbi:unnamed protein product [Alopecurus aequalis]
MRSPAGMDLFQAARVGNCDQLASLLEGGADANAYDRWDSYPLYYACHNGHYDAARMLLEAGAIYAKNTFEGERCYRGALNVYMENLLRDYEGRPPPSPPPLAPLPAALLSAFLACPANRAGAESAPTDAAGAAPPLDITLYVQGRPIEAHRVILAARSPYFRAKLTTEWRNLREVTLPISHSLPFEAMYSLVRFFYSDRLEVSADTMEPLARLCRACEGDELIEMANRLEARKWLYRDSGTRRSDPRGRLVLQAHPAQHSLPSALRRILQDCLSSSREENLDNNSEHDDDPADVRIKVGDRVFRCHQMVLALRSEYFRTRLSRRTDFPDSNHNFLEEHDVSAETFEKMLEYVYTDELENLGDNPLLQAEELLDVASRYLLLQLKPVVADLLLPHLDLDRVSPAQLCRWLTLSDIYDVAKVRKHCLDVIAGNLEAFAEAREFRALLLASRKSAPADGQGGLSHDLRERWLGAAAAGLVGKDGSAAVFDERLEMIVLAAQQEANEEQPRFSNVHGGSCASLYRQIASRLMEVFCCILPPEQESNDKSHV